MKTLTLLRALLGLEWALTVVGVVLSFSLQSYLPPELQAWLEGQSDSGVTSSDFVLLFLGGALLIVMIVASIGLCRLRRWGAWLYLATTFLFTAFMPFMGPTVNHALADAVFEFALILSGAVIGIAFFGNVLQQTGKLNQAGEATS